MGASSMSAKEIPLDQVPAINIVQHLLGLIDPAISVEAAGNDFDKDEYVLKLAHEDWKGRVVLPHNLLNDVRQDAGQKGKQYTQELHDKVKSALQKAVQEHFVK